MTIRGTMPGTFAERRNLILQRLEAACQQANRDPADVRLLAASKTRTADDVLDAIAAGHGLFGENRAQERHRAAFDSSVWVA